MSAGTRYCLGPDVAAGETESSFRQPRARAPRLLAAGRPAVFFVETPPARAAVDRPMAPSRHLGTAHISTLVYSLLGERRLSNPGRCQASSSNGRRPVSVAGGMRAQRGMVRSLQMVRGSNREHRQQSLAHGTDVRWQPPSARPSDGKSIRFREDNAERDGDDFRGSPGRFRTVVTDALSIPDIRPRQLERSPTFPAT